jgi:hypothetical protein
MGGMKLFFTLIFFILIQLQHISFAQSCCSASTPVTGNLQISTLPQKSLFISYSFLFDDLSSTYDGSTKINENLRERKSYLSLVSVNYGITPKFTLVLNLPYIFQQRTNFSFNDEKNSLQVSGFGDISFMIKYSISQRNIFSDHEINIGLGAKLPTGRNSVKLNGILLAPELQPGTGSFDILTWFLYSHGYTPKNRISYQIVMTYTLTGRNSYNYEFGDEWLFLYAQRVYQSDFMNVHLQILSRYLKKEKRDERPVENTGGLRLSFSPVITFHPIKYLSISGEYQIPVYRRLNGIQLTTSRRIFFTISITK